MSCPFCCIGPDRVLVRDEYAFVIRDGFPISPGHSLIIPSRHVVSFFEVAEVERSSMLSLLNITKLQLDREFHPDAYNIGINDGQAAGQTVPHLHIHIIPRYAGDCSDPRGGVRWILPELADYWTLRDKP